MSDPSENADRMLAATAAAFLHSVAALRPLAFGCAAVALIGLSLGGAGTWLFACSALMTGAVLWLSFRTEFDARLFDMLSSQSRPVEHLPAMDAALVELGLIKNEAPRALRERVRGARRLARRTLMAHALQVALLVAGIASFLVS